MKLEDLLKARRDTRHFTDDAVPDDVLNTALKAGHMAPSVGLTDATRYFIIRSGEVKKAIKQLFETYNAKAYNQIRSDEQKDAYAALKLEAITDAPLGMVVCYDRSVLNDFTIGTVASNDTIKFSAVCAVQNVWLSLTEQGYSMGWVSILNYYQFKKILGLTDEIEPLGYFCIGKPATDYGQQPMLQQLGWKNKSLLPEIIEISTLQLSAESKTDASISKYSQSVSNELKYIIDNKTKPVGSLGMLEELALQIGKVFGTVTPQVTNPHIVVFAADHGIAQHGVSAYPQEVTRQMVGNFLEGGAAISVFCRQHGLSLWVADAGVNYDFAPDAKLINTKIAKGTQSFLNGQAMSLSELELCFLKGAEVIEKANSAGCNTIGFGEMGIGNTSSASVLMSLLCNIPLEQCIGKGTGLNDNQLDKKHQLLKLAVANYKGGLSDKAIMAYFGGFEIMQMAGAMLEAKKRNMLILVDGFISTVAYLCAFKLDGSIKLNTIFCHQSEEAGHKLLLKYLDAKPLLHLNLRLGEGTGCAVAFPIVNSAVAFLNEMASFENAGIDTQSL